jgi:hypothetical protein
MHEAVASENVLSDEKGEDINEVGVECGFLEGQVVH